MKTVQLLASALLTFFASQAVNVIPAYADDSSIARGRYLTIISGCNDCHTSGFAPSGGKVSEEMWLLGDGIGWKGPWGTTYPINLRKLIAHISKKQWLDVARNSRARPPMPSYVLNQMTETDLAAMYDFIRSLGDGGTQMPEALPPGVEPQTPYFDFTPKNLPVPTRESNK